MHGTVSASLGATEKIVSSKFKHNGRISAEQVREMLDYSPDTGDFRWRADRPRSGSRAGSLAGCLGSRGYRVIRINQIRYSAHRLAWLVMHGDWPPSELDHEDHNKSNNRFSNLRLATQSQNAWNRKAYKNNPIGIKGVRRARGKYSAEVTSKGKSVHLGYYKSPYLAWQAYAKAARDLHGEFACLQSLDEVRHLSDTEMASMRQPTLPF